MNFLLANIKGACNSDEDVIHIDDYIPSGKFFLEQLIYHSWECRGGVGKSKKHNGRLKEFSVGLEGGFPFIAFFYTDIVISPSNVKLGEPFFVQESVD